MAGCGAGVGVVVIAVGEVSPVIQEQPEAAVSELVSVALEVVPAKLVNDYNHDQPWVSVVGGSKSGSNKKRSYGK